MIGDNKTPGYKRCDICKFQIMAGDISPKVQSIDMILRKIFNGYSIL